MTTQDFTITLLVDATPEQAFEAINNVRGWWSENVEGDTDKLDAVFTNHYKDVHFTKMKIIELVPGEKVVWLVLDNYFKFTTDKDEWKGNKIVFEIDRKASQTQIRFTQHGLVPEYECYSICNEAWTNYVKNSLGSLITTGKGQPTARDADSEFDERLLEKANLRE